MRVVGTAAWFCVLLAGCATGTVGDSSTDSGTKTDSGTPKTDSGTPKQDSGTPPQQDSGTPPQQDSGSTNCGGQCLGVQSTCCSNSCVDITSDPNNCGGCGTTCGTTSCCAGNCIDTMGSDTANCGGCGITCNGTCTNGTCQTNNSGCTLDMGSCSHSPCTTGGALGLTCDSNDEGIVALVCIYDSTCCSSTWDATCVSWAQLFEANSCVGGGC